MGQASPDRIPAHRVIIRALSDGAGKANGADCLLGSKSDSLPAPLVEPSRGGR
jgi:hypothetical protein